MARNDTLTVEKFDAANGSALRDVLGPIWPAEEDLLHELVRALRTIQFGSINITLHDGRIVEIQKTERIRKNRNKENSSNRS